MLCSFLWTSRSSYVLHRGGAALDFIELKKLPDEPDRNRLGDVQIITLGRNIHFCLWIDLTLVLVATGVSNSTDYLPLTTSG
jgi:hypothetical protein